MKRLRPCALLLAAAVAAIALSGAARAGTLEDIRGRGVVTCAVAENVPGISGQAEGRRSGLAIDLCGIVAAAVLGRAESVAFVDVKAAEGILSLQAEEADILLVPGPWTFSQEVNEGVLLLHPLLQRERDGAVFGPVIRQGDDIWLVALRWTIEALRRGPDTLPAEAVTLAETQLGFAPGWNRIISSKSESYDGFLAPHASTIEGGGWRVLPLPEGMSFRPDGP